MSLKIKDMVDFIVANRKDKIFIGYTEEEIAIEVESGIAHNTMCYATDDGKITGVIFVNRDDENKVLFVRDNLAMTIKNLKLFATIAKNFYPGYTLQAMRHNCRRIFNTQKLYQKLS